MKPKNQLIEPLPMPLFSEFTTDIGSAEWKALIFSGAEEFGVKVTVDQVNKLTCFAEMLCDWNRKINLTAITDPEAVAIKHFIDSIAVLPFLPEAKRLLDIGSGGGFPGLVLAIFRQDLQITSIDAVRKKISFQKQIIRTLQLHGVQAIHTRAESLAPAAPPSTGANSFDIIVSRALGSLDHFVGLALPLLAPGGTIIAYKGAAEENQKDEMDSCLGRAVPLSIDLHTYCLPRYGDQRTLVFIKHK